MVYGSHRRWLPRPASVLDQGLMAWRHFDRYLRARTPLFGFRGRSEHQAALCPERLPDRRLHLIADSANFLLHRPRHAFDQVGEFDLGTNEFSTSTNSI